MPTFRDDYDLTVRSIQGATRGSIGTDAVTIVSLIFTFFKRLVDFVQSYDNPDVKTAAPNPFDLTQETL